VANLVLVNGPPASGKSTVAAGVVARRSLALNLDVDVVRGLLGAWRADPMGAGLAARRVALAMASAHLGADHDVIVPQFLAREEFIDQLAAVAGGVGARFVEVALVLPRAQAVEAFARRSASPTTQQHRDAAADVEHAGGVPALEAMYDAYVQLLDRRSHVRRIDLVDGDVAGTIDRIEAIMDERR
jgi:predicted kinase